MLADCIKLSFPSQRWAKVHGCTRNLKNLPLLFNNTVCHTVLTQRSLKALEAAQVFSWTRNIIKNSLMKTQNQILAFQGLCSKQLFQQKAEKLSALDLPVNACRREKAKLNLTLAACLASPHSTAMPKASHKSLQGNGFLISDSGIGRRSGP